MAAIMTERLTIPTACRFRRSAAGAFMALLLLAAAYPAFAQLDPLLFLKRTQPNVVFVVDTAERMQHDADGTYYDPAEYLRQVGGARALVELPQPDRGLLERPARAPR